MAGLLLLSQTTPQTAGERYKSVEELKAIPATQVIEVMSVIAGSLGVTCAHCHGTDWASDENPNKAKARQMIAMTRRVDREFGGTGTITCNTCHQGRAIPPAVSRVDNAGWNRPAPAASAPLPALDDVLQRYVTAMGGRPALERVTTRTFRGSVTRVNGRTPAASGTFDATVSLPGSGRVETAFSYPPEAEGEMTLSFVRPLRIRELYRDMKVTGRAVIGTRNAVVVNATTTHGPIHTLFFDEVSGLLLRRYSEKPTVLGPLPETFDFEDYRDAGAVKIAHVIHWSRADYRVTFKVERVR
ncbi:MAG: photosynthetic reaction center cytochrome c subunit [Acidobacteria bacterium]|nr:photosynthetic reaction center cytochrome c subunit [Acidobacteriota bacterium]